MDGQTSFVTTFSPAHFGQQDSLHRDVHGHLVNRSNEIIGKPIFERNHDPLLPGQTKLTDFMLEKKPGLL